MKVYNKDNFNIIDDLIRGCEDYEMFKIIFGGKHASYKEPKYSLRCKINHIMYDEHIEQLKNTIYNSIMTNIIDELNDISVDKLQFSEFLPYTRTFIPCKNYVEWCKSHASGLSDYYIFSFGNNLFPHYNKERLYNYESPMKNVNITEYIDYMVLNYYTNENGRYYFFRNHEKPNFKVVIQNYDSQYDILENNMVVTINYDIDRIIAPSKELVL